MKPSAGRRAFRRSAKLSSMAERPPGLRLFPEKKMPVRRRKSRFRSDSYRGAGLPGPGSHRGSFSRTQASMSDIATVSKHLFLLAFCAACSPPGGSGGASVAPADRDYATQTRAPSPDYRALLDRPARAEDAWRRREARSPLPADAKAIGAAWIARLQMRGALLGYGLAGKGSDGPVNMIDTGLTEEEFDHWARENGWSVPTHIAWSFVPGMALPPVSASAKEAIRYWPASTARTGAQNQALFHGRVELRDGCFFVGELGRPVDKLAWFHAEIGLDIDQSGYFILRERVSGKTLARLGEDMNWGGPASAVIEEAAKRGLQEACGPAEIYVVGSPEASERFLVQFPHLREPAAPPPPPAAASPPVWLPLRPRAAARRHAAPPPARPAGSRAARRSRAASPRAP